MSVEKKVKRISYDCLSDRGSRELNEDSVSIAVTSSSLSFILCDGLGGHGKGEIASSYVAEQMKKCLEQGRGVEESIMSVQQGLMEKQKKEHAVDSMKTTLACLSILNATAKFAYVGDSRIYLFEKGRYRMRSQDHSIPQMLVNSGAIKEKAIRHHEDRSRLLRVMGTEWNSPKYQVSESIPLSPQTTFLLCSDGFWELIDEKMMEKTLKKSMTPQEWLDRMEQIVLENGKGTDMDNYSAIAVFLR